MKEREYRINLNHLTASERFRYPDRFKEYSEAVVYMLKIKDNFLFEEELIEEYKTDSEIQHLMKDGMSCIDAIIVTYPDRFVNAGKRRKKKEEEVFSQAWFDLWMDYEITIKGFLYDLFFTYWLRHTDLLQLDSLLNYSLEKDYTGDKSEFIRFLKLTLRKHSKKLLQPEQTETINEWIVEKEKEASLSGTLEMKIKGKIKREREDSVTKLNQEQTALLIHFLQAGKIILKDEYLNNKEAGQAFSILTGYSADSLRQNLSKTELQRISTKKNVDMIANILTHLLLLIDKTEKDKK